MDPRLLAAGPGDVIVVVEPLYGCVAVAAALDAGWGDVEIAPLAGPPIPLVSFEQQPPSGRRGGRCRVRSDDLLQTLDLVRDRAASCDVLLGGAAIARPLCAQVARRAARRVVLVPVLAAGEPAVDAAWACGMLVRVLLDELETRDALLTDAAGIAVVLATGVEDPSAQLAAGSRWRAHLARGGAGDDLRLASSVDSLAVVPRVEFLPGGSPIARPWPPAAPAADGEDHSGS